MGSLHYVNYILAASNVAGYSAMAAFIEKGEIADACMTGVIMTASTLMHISETKHGLPGVWPWGLLSQTWLNIDRIMTVVGTIWFIWRYKAYIDRSLLTEAAVGLAALRISEAIPGPWFAPIHLMWHGFVYHLMYAIACKKQTNH